MDFALSPTHGPPRLLRFVAAASMPSETTLAVLDAKNNLLFINGDLYAHLTPEQKHILIRTRQTVTEAVASL